MYNLLRAGNRRYVKSFLCLVAVFILLICTAYVRPEAERLSYPGSNATGFIESAGHVLGDIISNENTNCSVIKNITLRNTYRERFTGSGTFDAYGVMGRLPGIIAACVLFSLYFCRNLLTSHNFIIIYIHNLDGMKPQSH